MRHSTNWMSTLDRIAEIPAHELTFEERLTLWAQLETLRLALTDAAQRCRRAAVSYHSTPVETQNSFCSGSDILTHWVPPKLCTPSSTR